MGMEAASREGMEVSVRKYGKDGKVEQEDGIEKLRHLVGSQV